MRAHAIAVCLSAALMATAASAQVNGVDLNGRYLCVRACASDAPGPFAFVTQNGWELNLVNEVGTPSRGWINYPGRLWVDRAQVAGIYSPDGMTIQFDNGTIRRLRHRPFAEDELTICRHA